MNPRVVLLATLVLTVTTSLAGCVQDQSAPVPATHGSDAATAGGRDGTTAGPASATAREALTHGHVRVRTTNADLDPLADVTVQILDQEATTGPDGFALLQNVPAGRHNLTATLPEWRTARALVHVTPGETTETHVKLLPGFLGPAASASTEPYQVEYDFEGVFECSATYLIITGDCLAIVDHVDQEAGTNLGAGTATHEQNAKDFPLDSGWHTIILEQVWEPVLPNTKMQLALEPAEYDTAGHAPKYARVTGEGPLYIRLDTGIVHPTAEASVEGAEPGMPDPAGGEIVTTRSFVLGEAHNAGDLGFLGVGAAYGQRFSVYITVFYGAPAPDGFTRAPE